MGLILKILAAPLVVALTLFVWICTILLYCTGMVLGLAALVVALLGVAVLVTYSLQNGIILLVIAFLISPMGLPTAAAWLLGKVQSQMCIRDSSLSASPSAKNARSGFYGNRYGKSPRASPRWRPAAGNASR